MKNFKFLGFILICFFCFSCKSSRISNTTSDLDFNKHLLKLTTNENSKYYGAEQMNISIITDESRSIKAKINIKRNDYIYGNANILGFEVGRFLISKDSIKFINRIEKTFFFDGIKNINEILNVDLNYFQIENLLLKGFVFDESDNRKTINSRISETDEFYFYRYKLLGGEIITSFFDKKFYLLQKIEIRDNLNNLLVIAKMGNFSQNDSFPEEISIMLNLKKLQAEIEVNVGKISTDRFSKKSFTVNSKYSEVSF